MSMAKELASEVQLPLVLPVSQVLLDWLPLAARMPSAK